MLAAAISAGANIASGIFGANAAKKAAEQQYKQQKEFAQNGIQWRAADAKAAGIHPLYAMGAQTHSYSPVSVGDTNPLSGLAAAGQDLSRAVDSTRSPGQKLDAVGKTLQSLALQRAGLENELLGAQIAKIRQGSSPGLPTSREAYNVPGQPDSGLVKTSPMARQSTAPGGVAEAGPVGDLGFVQVGPDQWAITPSKDAKDRIEDTPAAWQWAVRNMLAPSLGGGHTPPPVPLADNQYWSYNGLTGTYTRKTRSKSRMWTGGFNKRDY